MSRLQKFFFITIFLLPGLLSSGCSQSSNNVYPTPEEDLNGQPMDNYVRESQYSYYYPDIQSVIIHADLAVIAKVEQTNITFNFYDYEDPYNISDRMWYKRMRLYRIYIQDFLKGIDEPVLNMGWSEGTLIVVDEEEELLNSKVNDRPDTPPLEKDKLYLLFLNKGPFYPQGIISEDIHYFSAASPYAYGISESGEIIPIARNGHFRPPPYLTLTEFSYYIKRPDLIPTPTPWPTRGPVESYPIPLNTVVPYPFPLGTPFPYDTYPRP